MLGGRGRERQEDRANVAVGLPCRNTLRSRSDRSDPRGRQPSLTWPLGFVHSSTKRFPSCQATSVGDQGSSDFRTVT